MGNLLAYSGLAAKVRAMESQFITDRQFRDMAALSSVGEALDFLKSRPAYQDILASADNDIHRSQLEKLLILSRYRDFEKLYRFSGPQPRKFLNLYFMHFEISLLKRCLRNISHPDQEFANLSMFRSFFSKHSKLDLDKLTASSSISELTASLEGTPYHSLFVRLSEKESVSLFDYELQLDLYHFQVMWNAKDKYLTKEEKKTVTQCFGSQLDMLNAQWIYRSKKYYHLDAKAIYPLLIPVNYRLKKEDLSRLAETSGVDEFFSVLNTTYYGSLTDSHLGTQPDLEQLYEQVMNRIYTLTARNHPYSTAILNSYFYFKNLEIHRLITIIEGIRYGVSPDDIISYVIKSPVGTRGA